MRTTKSSSLAVAAAVALTMTAGLAALTQFAPPDQAAVEKTLIANENKIAEAIAKGDVKTAQSIIAADGWSADPGGFMPAAEFFKMVGSGQVKIATYKMSDYKFIWVNPTTAVLGYVWTGKGSMAGQPFPEKVHASTVWTKRGANWVAVFHQETPAMAAGK
jgi:Domain of unknown function (DUF4440)